MGAPNQRSSPTVGKVYDREYGGQIHRMKVVKIGSKVQYEVNGEVFPTPSAAGKHVTKNEVNGWIFWRID
jgi:hypothetical protein